MRVEETAILNVGDGLFCLKKCACPCVEPCARHIDNRDSALGLRPMALAGPQSPPPAPPPDRQA
jgi:hypothetical protein